VAAAVVAVAAGEGNRATMLRGTQGMRSKTKRIWLLAATLAPAALALADERVLDFHSAIRVATDSSMQVEETIRVRADGTRIKHGIVREFPTQYHDAAGNPVSVGFEVLAAERDGRGEKWRTERFENGVRVFFGDAALNLPAGDYKYTLRYRTTRQLGFFADHDELYWNATGTGWNFPIDHASADVSLPGTIAPDQIKISGFTGPQGAKSHNYRGSADAPSHAKFETTAPLARREGLTIAVGFPKGIVTPPPVPSFLTSPPVLLGILGLLGVLGYLGRAWWRVGRDPRAGPVMPLYDAPNGLTPGALRFVERRSYDDRCFAADLVDIAVRGVWRIRQIARKQFSLVAVSADGAENLPDLERQLHKTLLGVREELAFEPAQAGTIGAARNWHSSTIEKTCTTPFFATNFDKLRIGLILSLATVLVTDMAASFADHSAGDAADYVAPVVGMLFMSLFGLAALGAAVALGRTIANSWHNARGFGGNVRLVLTTAIAGPLALVALGASAFLLGVWAHAFGIGLTLALFAINAAFYVLLPAPTRAGRKLLDQIAGLRLYLGVAERDTIASAKAPTMTPEEFQRFLPYALALDVERNWTDRFAAVLGPAAVAASAAAMTWYYADRANFATSDFSNFSSSLGSSLSDAIAASSTVPGSSSAFGSSYSSSSSDSGGSSDSGSSGGGGGGGGGDGW